MYTGSSTMYVYTWGKTTAATIYQQQQHILIFTTQKKNNGLFMFACSTMRDLIKLTGLGYYKKYPGNKVIFMLFLS